MNQPHALPAELSIYTVAELHPQWLQWLSDPAGDAPFELDGGPVETADAAGVQLLVSLHAGLQRQGRTMHLRQPSQALLGACDALGLQAWAQRLSPTAMKD